MREENGPRIANEIVELDISLSSLSLNIGSSDTDYQHSILRRLRENVELFNDSCTSAHSFEIRSNSEPVR